MPFQASIHYKNDEEVKGERFFDFWEALDDLSILINKEVESEDGFNPEDVAFAQVYSLEGNDDLEYPLEGLADHPDDFGTVGTVTGDPHSEDDPSD